MAQSYNDISSEYSEVSSTPIAGYPFVVALWYLTDDDANAATLWQIQDSSAPEMFHKVAALGNLGGDPLRAQSREGSANADAATGFVVNAWEHACALFAAPNDRRIFKNGANKGTNADTSNDTGFDSISFGRSGDSSPGSHHSGLLAEVGLWDLSVWPGATGPAQANEFERVAVPSLGAGYSPDHFLLGLVSYWRLVRDENQDKVGRYNLTAFNTPGFAAHPPMMRYPTPMRIAVPTVSAAQAPVFDHHYRTRRL